VDKTKKMTNSKMLSGRVEAQEENLQDEKVVQQGPKYSRYLNSRYQISLVLTVIVLFLSIAQWIPFLSFQQRQFILWGICGISWVVVLFCGWPIFKDAASALSNKSVTSDVLFAVFLLFVFLPYNLLAALFPQTIWFDGLQLELYFPFLCASVSLTLAAKLLVSETASHASQVIRRLMRLQPKIAHVITDEGEINVPVEQVEKGQVVQVIPGERVPLDGLVREGHSTIDESAITGESLPIDKKRGDEVLGGTVNRVGAILFEVSRKHNETVLARVMRLVEEAQSAKKPAPKLEEKIIWIWFPLIFLFSLASGVFWFFYVNQSMPQTPFLFVSVYHVVGILMFSCPLVFQLAVILPTVRVIEKGAERGVIMKNADVLPRIKNLNAIVFDKTGTLTRGRPAVTDIIPLNGVGDEDLIAYAASAERDSQHPLAKAVVKLAKDRKIQILDPEEFEEIPGRGIRAIIQNKEVHIGNLKFMIEENVDVEEVETASKLGSMGKTPLFMAIDRKLSAIFAFMDTLKMSSMQAVSELSNLGLDILMLTGDNRRTAEIIAREVGIKNVMAEVLPEDKIKVVKRLQEKKKVIMVGDGINDAPALTQADMSIAMGTGTDVAMETSDLTLMRGDLQGVILALQLSSQAMRVVKQNFFLGMICQLLGIAAAADLTYRFLHYSISSYSLMAGFLLGILAVSVNSMKIGKRTARA
jgi:Cu+-exporting ATPase